MSGTDLLRGYAVVSVLWLIVLLTGIVASYHAQARVESRILTAALHRTQAEAIAEGAIWLAVQEHFIASALAADRSSRMARTIEVDGTSISVTIADASGLINLNNAQPELLAALLEARTDLDAATRDTVVDSILDWRDADSTRNAFGAEDDDYRSWGKAHGAKDAPFATVDELKLVRGMTPSAYRAVSPALTVFGNHSRVNVAAAPSELLAVLPRTGSDQRDNNSFDQRFVQQTGEDIYTASATAKVGDVAVNLAATFRYARGENRPVQVLAWNEASPAAASETR